MPMPDLTEPGALSMPSRPLPKPQPDGLFAGQVIGFPQVIAWEQDLPGRSGTDRPEPRESMIDGTVSAGHGSAYTNGSVRLHRRWEA